ncbi:MAG TPA: Clp protease N-terminal domain-containing protein [Rubrobacteraceae bacterium]|jgi:FolB domain-containing protein
MSERFTERARKVVVLAQEEARHFNHNYIGTEHLLLGLLQEDNGGADRVLNSLNIALDEVREQVKIIVGYGRERTVSCPPFTPRSKKVLDLALREAWQLGYSYIDTEHILLGLVREPEGVAARVLSKLGVDSDKVRREVVRMLGGGWEIEQGTNRPVNVRITLFRARVEGLMVNARCGVTEEERATPQPLRVDLSYLYDAEEGDELSKTVDYGTIIEGVVALLEREEFKLLETGVCMVGGYVMNGFSSLREVTVAVTKLNVPTHREVSGVSVEATFGR